MANLDNTLSIKKTQQLNSQHGRFHLVFSRRGLFPNAACPSNVLTLIRACSQDIGPYAPKVMRRVSLLSPEILC